MTRSEEKVRGKDEVEPKKVRGRDKAKKK